MQTKDDQVQETEIALANKDISYYLQSQKAEIDMQIATAKAFPRDLRKCVDNSIVTVTLSEETAKSCGYELPRGGKKIRGKTVHLAAIVAQNYGNLRAESRVTEVSQNYVSAEAVAFDLENNYAVKVEIRRKILDRDGKRYSEDLINTTGQAGAAIAYRNAVLRVIPRGITDKVYQAALNKITGDLSDEQKLLEARTKILKHYKTKYAATDEEIIKMLGIGSIQAIGQDEIATLIGTDQAIKDGDTTPDEVFERIQGENKDGENVQKKGKEFYNSEQPESGKPPEEKSEKGNQPGELPLK